MPSRREQSSRSSLRAERRDFLRAVMAVAAAGGLVGCDRSAQERARRLPSGAAPDPTEAATGAPQEPVRPRIIERPTPPSVEPTIRVRVATVRAPERRIRIDGEGPRVVVAPIGPTGSAGDRGQPKQVTTPAEFESTVDGWVVIEAVDSRKAGTFQFPPGGLEVRAAAGQRGLRLGRGLTGNAVWPDGLRLIPRTDEGVGSADLVCHIELERYLPGVLAKELYNTWTLETHMAQAIAARSYAVCEMARSTRRHFDVVAGELSQAWIGATTHKTSLDAASRTRGMFLVFGGNVVPAYYSSTCGGRPANAVDAISDNPFNSIPPLEAGPGSARDCCKGAPAWRWTMSLPTAETAKRVAGWARTERPSLARLDGIRRIEVATRNGSGRPVLFRIEDGRGQSFEIPSERLRWAFNASVTGLPEVRTRVRSGDIEPSVTPISIALNGRGFGHGVGMCQFGAEALTREGRTWRDLLRLYYPGAEVERTF